MKTKLTQIYSLIAVSVVGFFFGYCTAAALREEVVTLEATKKEEVCKVINGYYVEGDAFTDDFVGWDYEQAKELAAGRPMHIGISREVCE